MTGHDEQTEELKSIIYVGVRLALGRERLKRDDAQVIAEAVRAAGWLSPVEVAVQRAEWERGAAAEERRKIADEVTEWLDWYPTDIFIPGGTSVDARSADVIRVIVPNIAAAIRAEGAE